MQISDQNLAVIQFKHKLCYSAQADVRLNVISCNTPLTNILLVDAIKKFFLEKVSPTSCQANQFKNTILKCKIM